MKTRRRRSGRFVKNACSVAQFTASCLELAVKSGKLQGEQNKKGVRACISSWLKEGTAEAVPGFARLTDTAAPRALASFALCYSHLLQELQQPSVAAAGTQEQQQRHQQKEEFDAGTSAHWVEATRGATASVSFNLPASGRMPSGAFWGSQQQPEAAGRKATTAAAQRVASQQEHYG